MKILVLFLYSSSSCSSLGTNSLTFPVPNPSFLSLLLYSSIYFLYLSTFPSLLFFYPHLSPLFPVLSSFSQIFFFTLSASYSSHSSFSTKKIPIYLLKIRLHSDSFLRKTISYFHIISPPSSFLIFSFIFLWISLHLMLGSLQQKRSSGTNFIFTFHNFLKFDIIFCNFSVTLISSLNLNKGATGERSDGRKPLP